MIKNTLTTFLLSTVVVLTACKSNQPPPADNANTASANNYLQRDVRDDIFYFVLPDRFYNGDPQNDNGSKEHAISAGGLNLTTTSGFHGGDITGIEQKLDYLEALGVTAIWMTPLLRNQAIQFGGVAHHGYWIVDFSEIDPHFGGNTSLKKLIDAAHKKGIKVFFDIITNHTADIIRYDECHMPDGQFKTGLTHCEYKALNNPKPYNPFIPEHLKNVKYPQWLNNVDYYHNQGDSTFSGESSLNGDFNGLDDLKTEHPQVVSGMVDIYQNLIKEFKPDGFRIDTVRHVNLEFWQTFTPAIIDYAKAQGIPNFHVFGEVYDPNPKNLSVFTTEGKIPSVLDFAFQKIAADVFFKGENPSAISELFAQDSLYKDEDSQADLLMTFLGNHDMGRPGLFINQTFDHEGDELKLKRSQLAHAFMFLSRGIPVIYYGDEQGFTGDGHDIDAREDMFASKVASYNDNNLIGTTQTTADDNFNQQHPLFKAIAQLSKLRKNHEGLRRGEYNDLFFAENTGMFAFSRTVKGADQAYIIVFNSEKTPQTIEFNSPYKHLSPLVAAEQLEQQNGKLTVTLKGLSYSVYIAK